MNSCNKAVKLISSIFALESGKLTGMFVFLVQSISSNKIASQSINPRRLVDKEAIACLTSCHQQMTANT